jgi:hypothetical protein
MNKSHSFRCGFFVVFSRSAEEAEPGKLNSLPAIFIFSGRDLCAFLLLVDPVFHL